MNSSISRLIQRNTFKFGVIRAIVTGLVIQFSVAVPSSFAAEGNDKTDIGLHNSIAVLPFENLNPNPDDAYLAAGMHVDLIRQLTKIQDMSVISYTGIVVYGDRKAVNFDKERYSSDMPVSEVASALNVETVMKGRVRYADNRLNIAVELFDATGDQLWSEVYDSILDMANVVAVQTEIVKNIAMVLAAEITASELQRIEKAPTDSLEAYALYLKARILVSHIENGMPHQVYQYLDQAIEVDQNFALGHAIKATAFGISHSFGSSINKMSLDEMEKIATTHAEIALALDPNLYFANLGQALVHFVNGRHPESEQSFERALQFGPSSVEVLNMYSHVLSFNRKDDKAIRLAARNQLLTPNDASFHARLSMPLIYAKKYTDAAYHFREGMKYYEYHWLHRLLGMAEYLAGNKAEALNQVRIAEKILADSDRGPDALAAYTYSLLGLKEDAARIANMIESQVAEGKFITPVNWTYANLAIGKYDKAYEVLSQDVNSGLVQLQYLKHNMMKDPALEEPRFVELRNRIGSQPAH